MRKCQITKPKGQTSAPLSQCFGLVFNPEMVYILFMSQTYQPKKRKRARTHGFLKRSRTPGGRRVLAERRRKGRKRVAL